MKSVHSEKAGAPGLIESKESSHRDHGNCSRFATARAQLALVVSRAPARSERSGGRMSSPENSQPWVKSLCYCPDVAGG